MMKSQNSGESAQIKRSASAEEDLKYVDRCVQGDWSAFEFLYNKYKDKIFFIAYRYVQRREEAFDVVQEVFTKVYRSLVKFEKRSSFYTWLCRIAINRSIDFIRAKKNMVSYEPFMVQDAQEGPSFTQEAQPLQNMSAKEFQGTFEKALNSLPEIHRSVFILYALEDLSYKEISEVLDCSMGTIMSRLHYARKKLQELLKDFDYSKSKKEEEKSIN